MKYTIQKYDLFKFYKENPDYFLVHCIASDCALGAGIAVEFEKKFKLREILKKFSFEQRLYPTIILVGQVFNLITKEKSYLKPSYTSLFKTLNMLKDFSLKKNIKKLAMPKIGCGLDCLFWDCVEEEIKNIFRTTDIEIVVCYNGYPFDARTRC